jgi:hypothetical protein
MVTPFDSASSRAAAEEERFQQSMRQASEGKSKQEVLELA